jgi:hypothetical protein
MGEEGVHRGISIVMGEDTHAQHLANTRSLCTYQMTCPQPVVAHVWDQSQMALRSREMALALDLLSARALKSVVEMVEERRRQSCGFSRGRKGVGRGWGAREINM